MSMMTPPLYSFSLSRPLPGESGHGYWERLADFKRWPQWNPKFGKVSYRPSGEPGRGSVLQLETSSGKQQDWTIVHWEPELRITFIMAGKLHECAWCFEMPADSVPGDPRLTLLLELQCLRGARLLGWFLRWRLRRQANRFLDRLTDE